jgi:zinc transport system permease protein
VIALSLPAPFDLSFMQRAFESGVVVGVFAPLIGTFLVQKRLSLIGDGIGHVAFAGVGAGLLIDPTVGSLAPVLTALVFAVVGALGIDRLRARRAASGDLALALFFYSGIALGVVFVTLGPGLNANVLTYLFGQPVTVTTEEVFLILGLGTVIVVAMFLFGRAMFAIVTDEDWATVAGLPVSALNSMLAVLTACAVVAAMRIVGILLIAALMVLPVASAQLLARSFRGTIAWAIAIGVGSVIVGLLASWYVDIAPNGIAPSGAIVLTAALFFAIVAVAKRAAPRALRQEEHA